MFKITKYVIYDILRNKVLLAYAIFLMVISFTLFNFDADASKSIASLNSIVMIMVPLISIVFSTTYFYNSLEFIELLVAQPLSRTTIILGEFAGVALSMLTAFMIGIGMPVLIFSFDSTGFVLIASGCALTLVFTSLAFLASVLTRDKAKGIGVALLIWFYFSILYDGLVLAILFAFSDYPLEKLLIFLTALNPIDMARILILLKLDISALMGYTGALYQDFFGKSTGMIFSFVMMSFWILIPLLWSVRVFKRKNL